MTRVEAETPLEEEIFRVCAEGTLPELLPLLDKLRAESTKIQDYRPDGGHLHGHIIHTMLLRSLIKKREDIANYLVETFNPTRYENLRCETWAFDSAIDYAGGTLDVAMFRLIWQYNHWLATAQVGHLGHPLGIAMLCNNLPMVEFLVEHGADPVYDYLFGRWISWNDYETAPTEEMKDLLRKLAKLRAPRPNDDERSEESEHFIELE